MVTNKAHPTLDTTPTAKVFRDLAFSRRSVRRYLADPVSRALLQELVDLATRAPSNFNRQPWQFVILDKPGQVASINRLLHQGVEYLEQQDQAGELYNTLDHVRRWLYPLETAAAIILAFYKPHPERLDKMLSTKLDGKDPSSYNPNLISLGMAIQNLLLAVESVGLGACMHSGPLPFLHAPVNRLLNLPARLELAGLISLGWPDEFPEAPKHRDLEKVLKFYEGDSEATWSAEWGKENDL